MNRPPLRFQSDEIPRTDYPLTPGMDICQSDYPLDWYQQEFIPYAEEYAALPDRTPESVLPWMESYLVPALRHFGDELLLLAHYYMGGEIVKLVERFGGQVADSYQLALMARKHPERRLIVESAVHFMAETIAILAEPGQRVFITNPKSGCTMEMLAKADMVSPAIDALCERYGAESILPVCYMNTSGRVKALAGELGGAVCTSSNAAKVMRWAIEKGQKILFVPDRHLGENVASEAGIAPDEIAHWPGGHESFAYRLDRLEPEERERFDRARLILFGSYCGVHTFFEPWMADYWRGEGYGVVVHPECPKVVVDRADGSGSTSYLWNVVLQDQLGKGRYAVATEGHFVRNLERAAAERGIEVVNLGDAMREGAEAPERGCGCATMSRNDPPHLVALVDLLYQGKIPEFNEVLPGDEVDEFNGRRQRLDDDGQRWLRDNARLALDRMIEIAGA